MINKQQLLEQVNSMPAFPKSVHQILALTSSIDYAPKDVVKVIEHDPVMTIKVLKLVNSSFFSLSGEVTSVGHAVVYLGINTIKNLVISIATAGALAKTTPKGMQLNSFWLHSLTVAVIAKRLAEHKNIVANNVANYFVAGLLHDIGRIVFAHFQPELYSQVIEQSSTEKRPLVDVEKQQLGFEHGELGAAVAKHWLLPESLTVSICHHHALTTRSGDIEIAVYIANIMAGIEPDDSECAFTNLSMNLQAWLAMSVEQFAEFLAHVDEDVEKAMIFIQP